MTLEQFSLIVGIGLIIGQVGLIVGWGVFALLPSFRKWITALCHPRGWIMFGLLVVLGAMIGSLIYSNIYELEICHYCWYQRMALYPQIVILAVGLWRRESITSIISSSILSVIALAVALYHYALNLNTILHPESMLVPCDATGISCAAVPLRIFGYITIPFMTIVVALILISVMILALKTTKK